MKQSSLTLLLTLAGTLLLQSDGRAQWEDVWKTNGQQPRQVTQYWNRDVIPDWSPVDDLIAFASLRDGNWDIYVVSADGGEATQITSDPSFDSHPRWSPDGTEIVFQSDRSGNSDIWVIPATGGVARRITYLSYDDTEPCWSPSGGLIAFKADRSDTSDIEQIWTIPADGSGVAVQITTQGGGWPTWSPDGEMIAFESDRDPTGSDIWVIPATGGEATRLTYCDGPAIRPDWSNGGDRIAFVEELGVYSQVFSIPATGGERTQWTFLEAWNSQPSWSPNDTQIAFDSDLGPAGIPGHRGLDLLITLHQNWPNPFNPSTRISVTSQRDVTNARVMIYDAFGRRVRSLPLGHQSPGRFSVLWDGRNDRGQSLSSGVYFYQFIHDRGKSTTMRALLIK